MSAKEEPMNFRVSEYDIEQLGSSGVPEDDIDHKYHGEIQLLRTRAGSR